MISAFEKRQPQAAVFVAAVVLAMAGLAYADFDITSFGPYSNMTLNHAAYFGARLRVSDDAIGSMADTAWYNVKQNLGDGFVTRFQYQMTWSGNPGDGFAFVIQNASQGTAAIGSSGGGLGYSGIANSLAIEFDTYVGGLETAVGRHVAVHTNGAAANSASHDLAGPTKAVVSKEFDQAIHTVEIVYTPGPPATLSVYYDDMDTPMLTCEYDLSAIGLGAGPANPCLWTSSHHLGWPSNDNDLDVGWAGASYKGKGAFVGFSAGTGGAKQNSDIINWSLTETVPGTDDIQGYSYSATINPSETPDTTLDLVHGTDPHAITYTAPPDGVYYFHLRTQDTFGTWSGAVHLGPFVLDSTASDMPALSTAGLMGLAGACALAAVRRFRRRR